MIQLISNLEKKLVTIYVVYSAVIYFAIAKHRNIVIHII